MEFVLFEEVPMGGHFVHNNLNYERVSRNYASMDSLFIHPDPVLYFNWTAKVQVPRAKKV